jgi:aspartate/glutamate racemase
LKDRIRKTTNLPFLDMVEEVSKEIKIKYNKIGIICTSKTRKERLYDNRLQDVEVVYPSEDQQKRVSDIILRIIRKNTTKEDRDFLFSLVDEMISSGAEKVLLACTDLANILGKDERFIDSVDVLIERIKNET